MWALIFTWKFVCDRFLPGSVLILPRSGFQISVASLFPGEGSHALNFVKFLGDVDMKTSLRITAVCCYPLHSLPSVCLLRSGQTYMTLQLILAQFHSTNNWRIDSLASAAQASFPLLNTQFWVPLVIFSSSSPSLQCYYHQRGCLCVGYSGDTCMFAHLCGDKG